MIRLKRKQAELYGYTAHPYDALLDEYEKGATVAMLDPLFKGIGEQLPLLLNKIKAAPQVSNDCFHQHFPKQQQWDFGIDVLKCMGFDFEAGACEDGVCFQVYSNAGRSRWKARESPSRE